MEHLKELLSRETAGLPNWVWLGVIVVGLGMGFAIHTFTTKKENADNDSSHHSRNAPSRSVSDNAPAGDSLEGGFPIEASQTNTSLPYAGLPANSYSIINEGGLSGLPPEMLGSPYLSDYRNHHRWHHRHRRGEKERRGDMREHNLEGHGQNPRGAVVAASVGSR